MTSEMLDVRMCGNMLQRSETFILKTWVLFLARWVQRVDMGYLNRS